MKLTIEINMDNAAFDGPLCGELSRILSSVTRKVESQLERSPECICDAPEIDDKLLDINGNTVGSVRLQNE